MLQGQGRYKLQICIKFDTNYNLNLVWINHIQNKCLHVQVNIWLRSCPFARITRREIAWNLTEIGLYLQFSDWCATKRKSVWFQINRKMFNTIWFKFYLIIFGKDFSVRSIQATGNILSNYLQSLTNYCVDHQSVLL